MHEILPLRHYRLIRGWSLDDVAKRLIEIGLQTDEPNLGVTGRMVGRWERGEHSPGPPYPKLLCTLFEATALELGIMPDFRKPEPCGTLKDDMDRREVLGLLSTALAAPVFLRGEAATDRLAHALRRPSRVDHKTVSVVESVIADVRRLDDVAGSRIALRPALAQRDMIRTLLQSSPQGPVADRLLVAGGQLSQFLGYLTLQINDPASSRRFYGEALELAREAGDEALGAYVLGHTSILVGGGAREPWRRISRDGLHEGLVFAEAATSRSEASGSVATRSWVATVEAEIHYNLGDLVGVERALDRARTAFARFRAEDEPPWMYWYDEGYLEGHFGVVYLALGQPDPARRAIELALATLDPSMVRDRACHLARLAETYVPTGAVDEVCRLAGDALDMATDTQCDRAVLRVRRLRAQLERWASDPMVRELDEQLASTAAWVHSVTAA